MERIAPLAKILAEANGIDWQHLQGSGEGGQIVEQDILTHLARIMTGEEEPPPTPVDAPPPDWNGQDIPGGGMFSADMLSKAGVDSDIAAFVEQTRPGADVAAPAVSAEVADEDMEFELEEEETPAAAAGPIPTPITVSQPAQPIAAAEPVPAPAPASVPAATPPASGGAAAGLGSLLSRLYKTSPAAETPAQPAASATPAAAPVVPVQPPVTPAPVMAPTPVAETPAVHDTPAVRDTPVVEEIQEIPVMPAVAASAPVVAEPVEETPAAAEVRAPAPTFPAVSSAPEPVVAAPFAAQPEPVVSPVATPGAAQPAPVQPAAVQDATWFGVYLRRDANLGAVTDLRMQLTDALGQDVPLSLLVARAAQRHTDRLGLSSVALHDGQRTRSVGGGHLRDALLGLDTDHAGTPDLLIVDAGARDLDDLHFPHTLTLSVGRVQDGRAALSLNGNVDTAQAAQFLADLAGTLERPIVLVL